MNNKEIKKYNIPIFIPHEGCPHTCVFCNQKKITGVDTSVSVDDIRRIIEDYLGFIPRENRYVEIAFFGGSFTGLPLEIQEKFLKTAEEYKDLTDGIRMSTRPDYINDEVLSLCSRYRVRTIELGLQSADDGVLSLNEREHTFEDTVRAAKLIKGYGISLGLQMMVGMYGSSPNKDIETALAVAELEPECVRIYPTLTLVGTKLEKFYKKGLYTPYSLETAIDTTDKIMKIFEERNIEIIRVGLHSDESLTAENNIAAGPYHPAFRSLVLSKRHKEKIEQEILRDNIRDCIYEVYANPCEISEVVGHKRCNAVYFKEKYNVELKVKSDKLKKGEFTQNDTNEECRRDKI